MRLLVVSHPCVMPSNQALFAQVANKTGWDVHILVPRRWRSEYGEAYVEQLHSFRGSLHPKRVVLRGNIPLHFYAARLRREVERLAPDVVYAHHEPYALATGQVLAAVRGKRCAFGFFSVQNIEKRFPRPIAALERAVFARADFALPVSDAVLDVLRAKGYRGPASVLPLPVDLEPRAHRGLRPLTVGFVGRLVGEKGVDLILEALRDVQDARAIVVGEGPDREALATRAASIGVDSRVEWRGYVPHDRVGDVYGDMDVLAVPSRPIEGWTEQFGRVVVEALACGVPVIASDSGELPRLIAETGGGWIFRHDDSRGLAQCIREAADPAERARRAEQGRRKVSERFTVRSVATGFVEAVEGALAGRTVATAAAR